MKLKTILLMMSLFIPFCYAQLQQNDIDTLNTIGYINPYYKLTRVKKPNVIITTCVDEYEGKIYTTIIDSLFKCPVCKIFTVQPDTNWIKEVMPFNVEFIYPFSNQVVCPKCRVMFSRKIVKK